MSRRKVVRRDGRLVTFTVRRTPSELLLSI
jgi:hypothetical protein